MVNKFSDNVYSRILDGINIRTLVYGDKTLMSEFRMEKGSALPDHSHPYEQTGYLVSGKIKLYIGGKPHEMLPGDSWCIPSGTVHHAEILDDSVAVEVFSPAREDYLKYHN